MKSQELLPKMLVASVLACALALTGCGGSSASGDGDAQQDATQEQAADGADAEEGSSDVEETPSRSVESVAGIYLLDDSTDNVITVYRLKKDGTFIMRVHVGDTSFARKGTFEIRDDKVYANVPEGESGKVELQGTPMTVSAPAIVDAELVIEGNKLTTDDIGTSTITAYKISKEEYEAQLEKVAAAAPKRIAVGETVTADGCTFTVNSFDFCDEIYPSDTSGYYTYFQHQDNRSYLVADITYTNTGTNYQVPGYATAAYFYVGKNKYEATIETDGGPRTSQAYSIEAKDSGRVIIYASVPNAARDEGGEVKLYWSLPPRASLLNYYYSSSNDNLLYILTK